MKMPIFVALLFLAGCATQATLTVGSQPEGAYISEATSGTAIGIAPVAVNYDPKELQKYKDAAGCYLVRGFQAKWVSGATTQLSPMKLCLGPTNAYAITLSRDMAAAGLDKDMQFALQVQTLRAQQQQAQANQTAAAAALLSAWQSAQPVNCQSSTIGNQTNTNCR